MRHKKHNNDKGTHLEPTDSDTFEVPEFREHWTPAKEVRWWEHHVEAVIHELREYGPGEGRLEQYCVAQVRVNQARKALRESNKD